MLIQEDNPGIDFEYSMPSGAVKAPGDDRYVWSMGDWSECSGTLIVVYQFILIMIYCIFCSLSVLNIKYLITIS